jgi:pimeloyl-ACP methyl ester carboxylesterase
MPTAPIDDGLEMYYEDHDFAEPWRPHETVVLHAGNLKDHRLWYAWVPLLAQDYRVITLDARGHGSSTVPAPGYPWSLSNFARDLKGLLDFLQLDRVHLIGETTGGPITLQYALEYPERAISVTQCSAYFKHPVGGPTGGAPELVEEIGVEAWVRRGMHRRVDPDHGDTAHAEWYAGVMASTPKHVVVETLRYLSHMDMTSLLPAVTVPTLILAAEHSETRAQWSEPMHALIPGSKLVVIPGVHGFVQHAAPEECAAAWKAFVRELG